MELPKKSDRSDRDSIHVAWRRAIYLFLFFLFMISSDVSANDTEKLQVRIHGDASLPTLIYLPGLHGDWTLIQSFSKAIEGKARFVEFTYPRTLEWSLADYAAQIEDALVQSGVTNGWLLAESFGSQVAWALLQRKQDAVSRCHFEGVVLAGGFVKHPNALGVALLKNLVTNVPEPMLKGFLRVYERYAKLRHRRAPETFACIDEFIARRTFPDRQAMRHRLDLIANNSPIDVVRKVQVPVYALSGFWDPIVPRMQTRFWLKRNCAGFSGAKTIFNADHTVLATQPAASARVILKWMEKKGVRERISLDQ